MKKVFFILVLTVLGQSCTFNQKPEFVGIDSVSVKEASANAITLLAEARFNNKNDLGGTLLTDEIKVYVDGIYLATVSSEAFDVPAKDNFIVPLVVNLPLSELFKEDKGNLFGAILNQVLNKKMKVEFKGNITYRLAGFSYDYAVDHSQEITIQ
ncbi:hypothetical protein [Maribacter polysiphoniae]|uniref:hypothetical protein n=1 Tax=Maribacter polysiphoniae TaxID=429344 RepID=UPI0023557575|nr:hypothetical protein [Maribacter polysiphoniae]